MGVYDAVVLLSENVCRQHYSPTRQAESFGRCRDAAAQTLHHALGVEGDARGRYVFALLARREFADTRAMSFAYEPLPSEDRDMHVIFDGLEQALAAQWRGRGANEGPSGVETDFFRHLEAEGFKPTPTNDGSIPLLAEIMRDPDLWSYELTRRFTERLVQLERQAEDIYAAREPDPEKRPETSTKVLGATAFVLRSATYRYPEFEFAPSTAPPSWGWRNVIPYETAWDFAQGDFLLSWQPTWKLSRRNTMAVRGTLGFAGGLLGQSNVEGRRDFLNLGLDLSRQTGGSLFSSWGVTPAYRWQFGEPETGDQGSFGADVHVSVLGNRLRVSMGSYDVESSKNNWFFTIGITDLPGLAYWLSR